MGLFNALDNMMDAFGNAFDDLMGISSKSYDREQEKFYIDHRRAMHERATGERLSRSETRKRLGLD